MPNLPTMDPPPRSDSEIAEEMRLVESDLNQLVREATDAGLVATYNLTPHGLQVQLTRLVKPVI